MQIGKKNTQKSGMNQNGMFLNPQRDSSQDIQDKFDMLAQFYQPANANQATFDNMYDNINLDNVVMTSNKQTSDKQNDIMQNDIQGNHQVSGKTGKYSSPKTSKYGAYHQQ